MSVENSEPIVQERLWRASYGYQFLVWRRRWMWFKRTVRKALETAFIAGIVLGLVALLLFLLFGVGSPLP